MTLFDTRKRSSGTISHPIFNLKSMLDEGVYRLFNLRMMNSWYNINTNNKTFTFTIDGSSIEYELNEGYYDPYTLRDEFTSHLYAEGITVTYNRVSQKFIFEHATKQFSFNFVDNDYLAYILGWEPDSTYTSELNLISTGIINMIYTRYILVDINDNRKGRKYTIDNTPYSFKIDTSQSKSKTLILYNSPSFHLESTNYLDIKITDEYGFNLDIKCDFVFEF